MAEHRRKSQIWQKALEGLHAPWLEGPCGKNEKECGQPAKKWDRLSHPGTGN